LRAVGRLFAAQYGISLLLPWSSDTIQLRTQK
jgi:hypothetical protein